MATTSDLESLARALRPAAILLQAAAREVRVLGAATPENLIDERRRMTDLLERGGSPHPAWRYSRADQSTLRRRLEALVASLDQRGDPLARLYRERAEELELECALSETVGTSRFGALVRRRFGDDDAVDPGLAFAWGAVGGRPEAPAGPPLRSDDPSPASLASRMRAELRRRRLPFVVRVVQGLSALAATGERQVLVAAGRLTRGADVERTVLHEICGHVVPRARAAAAELAILRFGSARGTDDQEGYALWLEERAGYLDAGRARELAGRRLAAALALAGEGYGACARTLMADHGFDADAAARIAERAYRGGDGGGPGLVRDRAYLNAWLRVRDAIGVDPDLVDALSSGQLSLEAAVVLRNLAR